jgi:hypothetical protein
VLHDIEDHVLIHPVPDSLNGALQDLLRDDALLLQLLQQLAIGYSQEPGRHIWHDLDSAEHKAVLDTKSQLLANISYAEDFYDRLKSCPESRLGRNLQQLLRTADEQSLQTLISASEDTNDSYLQQSLVHILESNGIDRDTAYDHRNYVHKWVQQARSSGRIAVPHQLVPGVLDSPQLQFSQGLSRAVSQVTPALFAPGPGSGHTLLGASEGHISREPSPLSQVSHSPTLARSVISRASSGNENRNTNPTSPPAPRPGSQASSSRRGTRTSITSQLSPTGHTFEGSYLTKNVPNVMPWQSQQDSQFQPSTGGSRLQGGREITLPGRHRNSIGSSGLIPASPGATSEINAPMLLSPISYSQTNAPIPVSPRASIATPSRRSSTSNAPIPVSPSRERASNLPPVTTNIPPSYLGGLTQEERDETLRLMEEEPPSPVEFDLDLAENAQQIVIAWNRHDWESARMLLQQQITAVENGSFYIDRGTPYQPTLPYLIHLQGVACSLGGQFLEAKRLFKEALHSAPFATQPDMVQVASARWLAETCVLLNETYSATMAWAYALYGSVICMTIQNPYCKAILEDLNRINASFFSLTTLKRAFASGSTDLTKVFDNASMNWKLEIITRVEPMRALDTTYPRDASFLLESLPNMTLDASMLLRPINTVLLAFSRDPTFQSKQAIELLVVLTKPRQFITPSLIPTNAMGSQKKIFFRSKHSSNWLILMVRNFLETFAMEYKVIDNKFVLRLSERHSGIAYYQCFYLMIVKVPFRSAYGLRLSEARHTTRSFGARGIGPQSAMLINLDEQTSPEVVRNEIIGRINDFMTEKEKNDANEDELPSLADLMNTTENNRFELSAEPIALPELMASTSHTAELDGRPVAKPVTSAHQPIFELPG